MLSEMVAYIKEANAGTSLSEQKLLEMYSNNNFPFSDTSLNNSDKELRNKTYTQEISFFEGILSDIAQASQSAAYATQGSAGLILRSANNYILVNEKGQEYAQLISKGLMGAVFLNQIYNEYLTDAKTGSGVDNKDLIEGKNYTLLEHHFDEAFGYWGVNVAFDANGKNQYWGNYSLGDEGYPPASEALKNAFLTCRTAIINKDYEALDLQKAIIYKQFEITVAAGVIRYIDEVLENINNPDKGEMFHAASEGLGFIWALKYNPYKTISDEQLDQLMNTTFGDSADFWTISADNLNKSRALLISLFPELDSSK